MSRSTASSDWSRAGDSTYQHVEVRPEACLAKRGCPFEPAPLRPCPRGLSVLELDAVLSAPERYLGQEVLVRGPLRAVGGSLLRYCGCCNGYSGALVLVSPRSGYSPHPFPREALGLFDVTRPEAFLCSGDDTRACCGFSFLPGEDVIALGTLISASVQGGGSSVSELRLQPARLCRVDAPEVPARIVPVGDGCSFLGRIYGSSERIVSGDLQCGCFRGRVSCVRDPLPLCFQTGDWYRDGEGFTESDAREALRICDHGEWRTRPIGTP